MPMTDKTVAAFNDIIDGHIQGRSPAIIAGILKCNEAAIRSVLSLARKTGTIIPHKKRIDMTPEARKILSAALKKAHADIAALVR